MSKGLCSQKFTHAKKIFIFNITSQHSIYIDMYYGFEIKTNLATGRECMETLKDMVYKENDKTWV